VFSTSYDTATGIQNVEYEVLSSATNNTITVAVSNMADLRTSPNPNVTRCTSTFKLIAGYALDLKPPTGMQLTGGL
jgi:hypothetical protein